jgi:hypothetical protein
MTYELNDRHHQNHPQNGRDYGKFAEILFEV